MSKRKLYPDSTFAPGDMVVEYVPYPNQENHAFDDGPRRRYDRHRGTFVGNLQEYGYGSIIKVGEEEVEVARSKLCFDVAENHKSSAFIERHARNDIKQLESLIETLEERYMRERGDLEKRLAKLRDVLEKK